MTAPTYTSTSEIGVIAHIDYPHHRASLDRLVMRCPDSDGPCGLQIKTRSAFKADDWRRDVPDDVWVHLQIRATISDTVGVVDWDERKLARITARFAGRVESLAVDGMTLLMVTHEMNFARKVSDRVIFMHQGLVHEQGTPAELFANPKTPELQQFLYSLH